MNRAERIEELCAAYDEREIAEMYVIAMEAHDAALGLKRVGRPLGERVLVKVLDAQQGTTQQPTFMGMRLVTAMQVRLDQQGNATPEVVEPDTPQPSRGIIVAVGPGYVVHGPESRFYVELDVKVGDEVLFFEEKGLKIKIDGEELVLIPEQLLLMVLDSLDGDPARSGVTGEDTLG